MKCRICQWQLESAFDAGRRPGAWALRHLGHCPRCRAQDEALRLMAGRLRAQASAVPVRQTGALSDRVMAAIASEAVLPARHTSVWLPAALAILVVAAFSGSWLLRRGDGARRVQAGDAGLPDLRVLFEPLPVAFVPEPHHPLDREGAALKNDLAAAGHYLLARTGVDGL